MTSTDKGHGSQTRLPTSQVLQPMDTPVDDVSATTVVSGEEDGDDDGPLLRDDTYSKQDRAVLDEEDEREKLLTGDGGSRGVLRRMFASGSGSGRGKRYEDDGQDTRRNLYGRQRGELMFAVDEDDDDDDEEEEYEENDKLAERKYGTPSLEMGEYFARVCCLPKVCLYWS